MGRLDQTLIATLRQEYWRLQRDLEAWGERVAVILYGPPGCGKDGQENYLVASGITVIATSKLLSRAPKDPAAEENRAAGKPAVGAETITYMVLEALSRAEFPSIVFFNGIARRPRELEVLKANLDLLGYQTIFLNQTMDRGLALERMLGRLQVEARPDAGQEVRRLDDFEREHPGIISTAHALNLRIVHKEILRPETPESRATELCTLLPSVVADIITASALQ